MVEKKNTNKNKLKNTHIKANPNSITAVRRTVYDGILKELTPLRLATILRNAEHNHSNDYLTLAEEMEERDLHYRAVLNTRKQQLMNLPIVVNLPANTKVDEEQEELITNLINSNRFKSMLFDLLDALGKGYSVVELNYEIIKNKLIPTGYTHKPPQWFKFKEDTLVLKVDDTSTAPLPKYKTITHIPQLKTGTPIRGGLARAVATAFMLKNYAIKDWASFLEVFGMPLRVGKYGGEATESDIETLRLAVSQLGVDAGAVIPESMQIEFINATSSGTTNAESYEKYCRFLDEQISKVVLGQTMTTDSGSSRSQAEVHNTVRMDILKADALDLAETINNNLIKPLIELNYGVQEQYPWIEFNVEEREDKAIFTSTVKSMAELGIPLSIADIRAKLELPEPESAEDTLLVKREREINKDKATQGTKTNKQGKKSLNFTLQDMEEEEIEIDNFIEENWEDIMIPIVNDINKVIDESTDLQDFKNKLNTTSLNTEEFRKDSTSASADGFINGLLDGKIETKE